MSLTVHRPRTVDRFLEIAGDYLAGREAEHNLLFGICTAIRTTPELFADDPPRFAVVTDDARVVLASLRTPPHNQVVSLADDPAAIDALVDALAGEALPGVLAPSNAVARFVDRWRAQTGQSAHLEIAERIFRLERVRPPTRPAAGSWRMAGAQDRELIVAWLIAFSAEALPEQTPVPDPYATADRWIAGVYRQLYLWEDRGRVVSMVGVGGETPNGIRVGPVYTPPEHRDHGYATSLTAAASADQLARGRRFCFLFTDLSNPTSNRIYQAIGYEPVSDVDWVRFDP